MEQDRAFIDWTRLSAVCSRVTSMHGPSGNARFPTRRGFGCRHNRDNKRFHLPRAPVSDRFPQAQSEHLNGAGMVLVEFGSQYLALVSMVRAQAMIVGTRKPAKKTAPMAVRSFMWEK